METDAPKPKRESILASLPAVVVVHALIPVGILLYLVFGVTGIRQWANRGLALPSITTVVLNLSTYVEQHLVVAAGFLAAFLALDASVYYLLRQAEERLWARLWWWFIMGLETLLLLGVFNAVRLPYTIPMNIVGG